MTNQLIKQAISESYTEHKWLLIMLKQQWRTEGSDQASRELLQLNDSMTVEIMSYATSSTIRQVYIGLTDPDKRRLHPISCAVDLARPYEQVRKDIASLLLQASHELFELYRGRELAL